MTTVIPQSELTKRAIEWICEHCGPVATPAERRKAIEEAAMRFNLGPLEEEFLGRFFREKTESGESC